MPSGSPGQGYLSKAAFRLLGYNNGAYTYPTALGTPTPQTLYLHDKIPFISESLSEQFAWIDNSVLDGTAGRSHLDLSGKLGGGTIELRGHYLGLGPLIAAAFGYERVRSSSVQESPIFSVGTTYETGTATGGTSTTLVDSGKSWTTNAYRGMYVRVSELAASPNGAIDVRRIISNTATTLNVVGASFTTTPVSGDSYEISDAFQHSYEMSENLHSEPVTNIEPNAWNTSAYLVRLGVLGIDKGVAAWEWQACAVEEIIFKLNKDGLFVTVNLIPFGVDRRTSSRNSSSAAWDYHYHINQAGQTAATLNSQSLKNLRILRGDTTFRLGSYSTGTSLDSTNNLGVTEFELKVKNNLQVDLQRTASGYYRCEPARSGKREVTGSFTVPRHTALTRLSNYSAQDTLMATLQSTVVDGMFGLSDYDLTMYLRALKLTKADLPVNGPNVLEEKFNFTCLQPAGVSSGMPTPSTGAANSECIIFLKNFDPYNPFMGQHHYLI